MKKSIMRATLPHPATTSLLKILEPVKKAGFDGIQLGIFDPPGELSRRSTDADITKLARACRDAGLEPHSLVSTSSFFREDEADRKCLAQETLRSLEIAAALGARNHSPSPRPTLTDRAV